MTPSINMLLPVVELVRLEEHQDFGTFGVLLINKQVFCVTLEPNDEENAPFKSSIPAQQYFAKHHHSPKFGETFLVQGVPGRTNILFHPGNLEADTSGCIILAQHYGKLKVKSDDRRSGDGHWRRIRNEEARAVLNSGNTYKEFLKIMDGEPGFHLTVKETY